jgi:hypothetical protein
VKAHSNFHIKVVTRQRTAAMAIETLKVAAIEHVEVLPEE